MSTVLTPNRILQKGDEYRQNGTWKPVPDNDYGLQVMFTKYAEVRRPSEAPPATPHGVPYTPEVAEFLNKPISPQAVTSRNLAKRIAEVKAETISPDPEKVTAEKEKTPAPTPLGAGESPKEIAEEYAKIKFPKIKEAAEEAPMTGTATGSSASYDPTGPAPFPPEPDYTHTRICFPSITHDHPDRPIWTGRNGTFTGYGVELMKVDHGVVNITPIGKRGIGNCCIQFPTSVIPQIIDWLAAQYKEII